MKHLRHRDSTPDTWAYDEQSRSVLARFSTGLVVIPVCTEKQPRHGAFFLSRRGEDVWQISPTRCIATPDGYAARACASDLQGVHCEFLQLTDGPALTNSYMADLYETEDDPPTVKLCPKCNAKGEISGEECSLCHGQCFVSIEVGVAWEKRFGNK